MWLGMWHTPHIYNACGVNEQANEVDPGQATKPPRDGSEEGRVTDDPAAALTNPWWKVIDTRPHWP